MWLKKIAIHGFKSFADKVLVEFGPGITAIVGPNGCGKSNIIDAFRWVMGEQSAKAIRGERMLDLIFAGTTCRKPLNFAEVSLHFANEERKFPLDVSDVLISRKLHRDGESLYSINKAAARLKDVETLFWDTGLGKDAFSIFEQGKLDEIITSTPYDRRSIIEEAAGIMRFKQRKKEALRKLEQAEENLIRLRDIAQMTLQKKEHLKEQGEKARQYKLLEQELRTLEKEIAIYEMHKIEEKRARLDKQYEKSVEAADQLKRSKEELEARKEEIVNKRQYFSAAVQEALREVYEKSSAHQLKKQRLSWLKGEKERQSALKARLEQEERASASKEKASVEEKELLEGELLALRAALADEEAELQNLQKALAHLVQEQTKLWQEKSAYNERKMQRLKRENALKAELQAALFTEQASRERVDKNQHEESTITAELAALAEEPSDLVAIEQLLTEKRALVENETRRLQECTARESTLQADELELSKKLAALQGKITALDELQKNLHGYSADAKKLLHEGLVKPLAEVLVWREEVEKFLLPYQHLLLVDTEEQLQRLVHERELSDVALFCLEWLSDKTLAEHFGSAAFHESLPRGLQKESFGTGFWFDNKGALFVSPKGPSTVFSRKRERDDLAIALKEAEEALFHLRQEKKALQQAKAAAVEANTKAARELREQEMRKSAAEAAVARTRREKERLERVHAQILSDKERLKEQLHLQASKREEAEKALHGLVAEEESSLLDDSEKRLAQERQQVEREMRQKTEASRQESALIGAKQQRVAHLEAILQALVARRASMRGELDELRSAALSGAEEEKELRLGVDDQELQELKEREAKAADALQECEREFSYVEKELAENSKLREKQQQTNEHYSLEKAQNATTLLLLEESFRAHYGEREPYKGRPPEGSRAALQEALAAMGPINFSAVEELQLAEEETEKLSCQMHDLEKAKSELLAIVTELDRESGERFIKTFNVVQKAFQKNFSTLFGGGHADLKLVGSEDPLEAGIDIFAMPPGKSMKSLYLMSGGERCLTALALLFALFEVRPSPFCLLDEVDAPLDEANVERFAKMVSSYIDKTQFVIITHNKNTMAIADRLLGVSAEEKGVTKVIPLELKKSC